MTSLTAPYIHQTLDRHLQSGTIQLRTLLALLMARSLLCFSGQTVTAAILWAQGNPAPWSASVPYWNVFGSLADLGCLLILHYLLKKEGYRIWDLLRVPNIALKRDLMIGVGLFLLIFPTVIMGVTLVANLVVYGTLQPEFENGLLIARQLPTWATLYSLLVWWVIWSPTESMFYNGYLYPRFEARTGRTWMAVLIVGFFWTLQHIFFPFMPDGPYLVWRFIQFLGIGMLMPWLFSRLRRLRPLIVTHWLLDIAGVVLTIRF